VALEYNLRLKLVAAGIVKKVAVLLEVNTTKYSELVLLDRWHAYKGG
jgi:hypothetical protein